MKADTRPSVTSLPRMRRTDLRRRRWKKQLRTTVFTCWSMFSSASKKTPRSRTIPTGFMTSAPMYRFRSRWTVFFKLAFDPNQISSVFAGFNCSLLDLHQQSVSSRTTEQWQRKCQLMLQRTEMIWLMSRGLRYRSDWAGIKKRISHFRMALNVRGQILYIFQLLYVIIKLNYCFFLYSI